MDDTPVIGLRVRMLRKQNKLTQRKLARECDMDPTTLWRLEKGRTLPGAAQLVKLAKRLGTSFDELTGSDRDEGPPAETPAEKEQLDRVMEANATKLDRASILVGIRSAHAEKTAARLAVSPKRSVPESSVPPPAPQKKASRRGRSA